MGASSSEKRQHGNPQLKASGEVAPTRCRVSRDSPRTWTRPRHSSAGGTPMCGQFGSSPTCNGDFQGSEVDVLKNALSRAKQAAEHVH